MRRFSSRRYVPKVQSGHLYYVRLKTPVGKFYKIGFTAYGTVEERFDYGGSGDSKYIDKVLMFTYSDQAFDIEQSLHGCLYDKKAFAKFSANEHFPLSRNGQTELYIEDVLGLDPDYTPAQKNKTIELMEEKRIFLSNKSKAQWEMENLFVDILVKGITLVLFPAIVVLSIIINTINKKSSVEYLSGLIDRVFNGGKAEQRKRDAEIKQRVGTILNRL